jgi:hypothetical protein
MAFYSPFGWVGAALATTLLMPFLVLLRRRLGPILLSPVLIVTLAYVGLALAGAMFYDDVSDASTGAANVVRLEPPVNLATYWLFLAATVALMAGAFAYIAARRRHQPPRADALRSQFHRQTSARTRRWLLVAASVPLALTLVDYPPTVLLSRPTYLAPRGLAAGLGPNLAVGSVLVLSYLASVDPRRRSMSVGLITVYSAVFFALGSRRLSLVPVLALIGAWPFLRRQRAAILATIALVAALWLGQLPFFLRAQENHGLVPYAQAMPTYVAANVGIDSVLRGVLVSYPNTGGTAFVEPKLPSADLWISVDPRPGGLSGWYNVSRRHRFNAFAPYAGLGELRNHSVRAVLVYYFLIGIVLAHLDRRISVLLRRQAPVVAFALLGLVGLFVLNSVQYNLRSSTRLMYYALAIDIAMRPILRRRRRRQAASGGPVLGASSTARGLTL